MSEWMDGWMGWSGVEWRGERGFSLGMGMGLGKR